MATLKVAKITTSYVDGPGHRAVVYVAGCPICCPGCQSKHLWPADSGTEIDVEAVAAELLDTGLPVTISGGEPFAQPEGVVDLLVRLRIQRPDLHVIVYTGFCVEDILDVLYPAIPLVSAILRQADVLVDGPYQPEDDHDRMQWRGSSNQRVIDLPATFDARWERLVLLDWDTPTLTVTAEGDVIGAAGAMREMFDADLLPTRMCGDSVSSKG